MEPTTDSIIEQIQNWIRTVVIGLNFCPFARKPFTDQRISYRVEDAAELQKALTSFKAFCLFLDEHPEVETALLIFSKGFDDFDDYLDLVEASEKWIEKAGYEGIYQVASFHPNYLFAGSEENDPANYTNRSPYPMLHILREELLEIAINKHPEVESIPDQNISKARSLGLEFFRSLHF